MWQKRGLIFKADGAFEWNKSHAQVPVAEVIGDRIRIYYATRNSQGKSNISFIEVDKSDPGTVLYVHKSPLLAFGKPGTFDDSGMMPSSIVSVGIKKYLYYVGWTTRQTVPYQNAVGLAISHDGGVTFERASEGPVISVNFIEPYFSGTAFVLLDDNLFKMWYLSCIGWESFEGKQEPLYNIKYAESLNGIDWKQTGHVAIPLAADEGGLVSASVIRQDSGFRMWYGRRKKSDYRINVDNTYRIGYAESVDGRVWQRFDSRAGISLSDSGWDSEMISYPYVIGLDDRLLLFYNGNGFGRTGFGYAEQNKQEL